MNVKEAVEKAKDELGILLGEEEISSIRLEEVEPQISWSDEGIDVWKITFSYLPKEVDPLISFSRQRIYKTIIIDANGKFISMKIRELAQV